MKSVKIDYNYSVYHNFGNSVKEWKEKVRERANSRAEAKSIANRVDQKQLDDGIISKVEYHMFGEYHADIKAGDTQFILQIMDRVAANSGVDLSGYTPEEKKMTEAFVKAADTMSGYNREHNVQGMTLTKAEFIDRKLNSSTAKYRDSDFHIQRSKVDIEKIVGRHAELKDSPELKTEKREFVEQNKHLPASQIDAGMKEAFPSVFEQTKGAIQEKQQSLEEKGQDTWDRMDNAFDALIKGGGKP